MITNTTRVAGPYSGTGSQTVFSFGFKVFQASDLLVIQTDSSGNNTTLALTTQYTVTLNSNQDVSPGGTVTLVTATPSGYQLTLSSQLPQIQSANLTNAGNFYPTTVNNSLDYLTILIQQLSTSMVRGLAYPINDPSTINNVLPPAAGRAGKVLTFDGTGAPVTTVNATDVSAVAANAANITTVATYIVQVAAVAGNATNINAVAGDLTNISAVASGLTNINTVATNIASVNSVVTNIAAILLNATNMTAIQNAAANAASAAASATAAAGYVVPSQTGQNGKVLGTNGSVTSWITAGGGITWSAAKTSGFTAVATNGYPVNTTSGAITATLPASPNPSDTILLTDYLGTFKTNPLTINPNGLKINGSTSNIVVNTNGAAITLTYVDATQGWMCTAGFQNTPLNTPNTFGFKNRIINGGMQIDQRLTGVSFTPVSPAYCVDRWNISVSQANKLTVQQVTDAPSGAKNSLKVTVASSYSVLSTDNFILFQAIEGNNIVDLQFGTAGALTITTSFQVKSSVTGTFAASLHNGANSRSYVATYSIPVANVWTPLAITIPGDTTGVWTTDNTVGLYLFFDLGCGSNFNYSAGAWGGSAKYNVAGNVSFVGQANGSTWQLAQVQLEAGSVATSFDVRDYGRELALCQRYFEKSYSQGVGPGVVTPIGLFYGVYSAFSVTPFYVEFAAEKRAPPTMTGYTSSGVNGQWIDTIASNQVVSFANVSTRGGGYVSLASGTGGQYGHWTASAEL